MPAASPPCTWPSATSGLMIRPASSTRDHPLQLDGAGLGVDLDDGDVRAERERRLRGLEVDLGAQLGEAAGSPSRDGEIAPGERRLGRAGDVEAAVVDVEHHVLGVGLELVGGELLAALDDLLGGLAGGDAADLGRLRAVGARPARHRIGVALASPVIFSSGRPRRSATIMRERRLVALPVRERAAVDDRLARRR